MKQGIYVAVLAVAGLIPAAGQANMPHGWSVNPVNDVVYEVVSEGAYTGAAFWCAAGEYV